MPNNTDNAIKAAIRSMNELIVPSLDPENPLAKEQAALVIQLLEFLRVRVPYLQQRDRAELRIYHGIAEQLADEFGVVLPEQADSVSGSLLEAQQVINDPAALPVDLTRLADELRTAISDLVRASAQAPESLRQKVESTVVRGSRLVLDLQRSWFMPTGMVSSDDSLPDLESLLREATATHLRS